MNLDAIRARLSQTPPSLAPDPDTHFGDHRLNPDVHGDWPRLKPAAVLVGLVERAEPMVLLTTRAGHLNAHAGQVAFPGGKIDAGDDSPLAAALREAEEEIGLSRALVTPLGYATPYLTRSGYAIAPVLARIAPDYALTINPTEVDDAFEVPLSFLMDAANHQKHSRVWNGAERYFYVMPWENRYIWGVSAGIIHSLWQQVFS